MTFVPGNPVATDTLGQSRPKIQGNLDSLFNTFNVNHTNPNLPNPGTHTHVDLLSQAANPNPVATIVSHYSKAVSGVTEWFFQREAPGSQVIQMSVAAGTPLAATDGRTFLPGGLILLWGRCNYNTAATPAQNFQGGGFPNVCFNMQITPFVLIGFGTAVSLAANILSPTQFSVTASSSSGSINATPGAYYLAIGN